MLFITRHNPQRCVEELSDNLLMLSGLQCAEIMSSAIWNKLYPDRTPTREELPDSLLLPPYRRNMWQRGEKMALWAGEDLLHFIWIGFYFDSILNEYNYRFPDRKPLKYSTYKEYFQSSSELFATNYKENSSAKDLIYPINSHSLDIKDVRLLNQWLYTRRLLYSQSNNFDRGYLTLHRWTNRETPSWLFDTYNLMKETYGAANSKTAAKLGLVFAQLTNGESK
jgi:hypothetical protein